MDLGLSGKVAIVCAASKGLGFAAAEELGREGARVAVCARTESTLTAAASTIQSRTGAETLPVAADVTDESAVVRLVETVRRRWGRVDILVNNAGGPPSGPFEKHTADAWSQSVELNFLSAVRLCRHVVPVMREQRWGRIINIASVTVKQPVDGLILSNAVRAAVVGLAKSLATELGPHGILVNNVCPGYTRTQRLIDLATAQARDSGRTIEDIYAAMEKSIPLGRLGEPAELAALIAFLASERASYITGTTIQVDGGFVRAML